ncbi:HPr kinase/phosphorylase [Aminobacter sp. Piv2-1]|uniref:HPr kinase/phosphorylase n=1 Tax=Aminobacter sp. Piv2-1 TaxID=3031122 RepID=UPI0030B531F8
MPTFNMHATAVVLGDRGVLVAGPSGSGKSALALALVDRVRAQGLFARLVSDDQVFLSGHGGRLLCRAPAAIAGLAEIRGIGPVAYDHEPATVADLVVRLVPPAEVQRLPDETEETLVGCSVARLVLAEREILVAVPAVLTRMGIGLRA